MYKFLTLLLLTLVGNPMWAAGSPSKSTDKPATKETASKKTEKTGSEDDDITLTPEAFSEDVTNPTSADVIHPGSSEG